MRLLTLIALATCAAVFEDRVRDQVLLIKFDVAVVRTNGESVLGLGQNDFELLVDGQASQIDFFTAEHRALSLAFLLDVSASMYLTHTEYRFGRSWQRSLRSGDRVMVGSIGRPLRMAPVFTSDLRDLQSAVNAAFARPKEERSGPSPVWDSINAGVAALEQESENRRAIIVVTDGLSTGNAHSFGDVLGRAVATGASVSVVYAPTGDDRRTILQADGVEIRNSAETGLLKMADETGGLYRHAGDGPYADPEPHVEKIIRGLHEGYVLGFSPRVRDGKWHKLEVKVKRPGLVILARKAFVAPAS